jgi:hypothetical protein
MIAPCGSPAGYNTGTVSPAAKKISSDPLVSCTVTNSPLGSRNRNRGVYTTPPPFANPETFSVIVAVALTRVRAKFHDFTPNPAAISSNNTPNGGNHVASGGVTHS